MRWIGTADLSDLEGENPRYIRMQASVILRTWFMRGTLPTARRAQPVHTIHRQAYSPTDLAPTAAWWGSYNLWRRQGTAEQIASAWPRESGISLVNDALGDNDDPIVVAGPGAASVVVTGMSGGSSTAASSGTINLLTVNGAPENPALHTTITIGDGVTASTFELVSGLSTDLAAVGNVAVVRGVTAGDTLANLLAAVVAAPIAVTASATAAVSAYGDSGLEVTVVSDNDRVGLVTIGTALHPTELCEIVSVAGTFETDSPVTIGLEGGEGDLVTGVPPVVSTPRWRLNIPAGINTLHAFALVDGVRFTYYVAGAGTAADCKLSYINVRHIGDGARIDPTQVDDLGADWLYRWQGLEPGRSYLFVIRLDAGSVGNVSFEDDDTAPTFFRTQDMFDGMLGVVGLIQPLTTSAAVRLPQTAVPTGAYAVAFDGPYAGCTLPT
jgi:hypothetical protein